MKYILVGLACFFMLSIQAQNDWEEDINELEDVQVEIVKDREITLPKASRSFSKVPPAPKEDSKTELKYQFKNFNFDVPPVQIRIRPLKSKPEELQKLYNGFVKVGFGNYITPYFDGFFSNKRDKQYNYGVHLKHLSSRNGPVDKNNSGAGQTLAEAYGKVFTRKTTLSAGLDYSLRTNHYYGYNQGILIDAKDIQHNFNQINFKATANSIDAPITYNMDLEYHYIKDNYYLAENEFEIDLNAKTNVGRNSSVSIMTGFDYITQNDSSFTGYSRVLAYATPQYNFSLSGIDFKAGLNVTYTNDTLGQHANVRVYPAISASYNLDGKAEANIYFTGSTNKISYRELSRQNAFIASDNQVFYTNNPYTLGANIKANVGLNSFVKLGIDYGNYKNNMFYVNSTTNTDRFILAYDTGSISITNIFGEYSFVKNKVVQLGFRGDYFIYQMDILNKPYHRPEYKIGIFANADLYQKFLLQTDFNILGGIAATNTTGNDIELDPVVDFNLKIEYLFSKRFTTFVQFNNILGQEYQLLNRYPVKGFQVLAGITYSF